MFVGVMTPTDLFSSRSSEAGLYRFRDRSSEVGVAEELPLGRIENDYEKS